MRKHNGFLWIFTDTSPIFRQRRVVLYAVRQSHFDPSEKNSQPVPGIQCQVWRANIVFCLREDWTIQKESIKRYVLYGGFIKSGNFRKPPYLCRLLETICQFICFPWNDQYRMTYLELITFDRFCSASRVPGAYIQTHERWCPRMSPICKVVYKLWTTFTIDK